MADLPQVMRFIARNSKRTAVMVGGTILVVAGVPLLVLPGPGLLLIGAGLAVLATEFAWAERTLDSAKQRASGAARAVRRQVPNGGAGGRGTGSPVGRSDRPA